MSHHVTNRWWGDTTQSFGRQSHQSFTSHDQQDVCDTSLCLSESGSLTNHVLSWNDQQRVSDAAWFFDRHLINGHISCMMTNREWVTLLYFFASRLINHVSSNDQQGVSDTTLLLCQAVSWVNCVYPVTNRKWVTLLYLFAGQFHWLCLIPQPTACDLPCHFISLPTIHYPTTNRL